MKFLFWNLHRRPLQHLVAELAHDHRIDVLMLSECSILSADLLIALNSREGFRYSLSFSPNKDLPIYAQLPQRSLKPIQDTGQLSIREISPPIGESVLLVIVHLPSKLRQTEVDQALLATRWIRVINNAEQKVGHDRTLVVGDLNMNPFDIGVVGSEGFHAVMDRRVAERAQRKVQGEERRFFYNPMWGHLGDGSPGPPGTYYYNSSTPLNYFWHTLDQVLLRPALIKRFNNEDLRVVTATRSTELLTDSGRPDQDVGSDHLPIIFNLDLERSF